MFKGKIYIIVVAFIRLDSNIRRYRFHSQNIPMRRNLPQPLHPGILVSRVRFACANVDTARYRLLNNGFFLLLQQRDKFLFRVDMALNPPLDVIEESDDGDLFGEGWNGKPHTTHKMPICTWHFSAKGRCVHRIYDRF